MGVVTASDLDREIRLLRQWRTYLPKDKYGPTRQNVARKIRTARKMLRGGR